MLELNTSMYGLTPFRNRGFSNSINWFSETGDVELRQRSSPEWSAIIS